MLESDYGKSVYHMYVSDSKLTRIEVESLFSSCPLFVMPPNIIISLGFGEMTKQDRMPR